MNRNDPQHERTEGRLRALLGGKQACPEPMALGEWAMNLLDPAEADAVARHVEGCPACQEEVSQFEAFAEKHEEPSLLEEIREIVLEWLAPPQGEAVPALAGFRGSDVARTQTFTAGHLWLAVTVQEGGPGRRNLLALVTREDGYPLEHGTAWLSRENRLFSGGRVDPYGNLVISDLESGTYDLGIQCDGTRIWVRGVSV
ncbi:MAG TPA: zf-HC2 domain-containing protein [Symbiobacteriaceae bacterium]|nr:zf-HC2 domain-containing protein [Symbiobacteriaceae bacterium]